MRPSPPGATHHDRLERLGEEALQALDFEVGSAGARTRGGVDFDLLASRQGKTFIVQTKVMKVYRTSGLQGAAADAVLRLRHARDHANAEPLLAIGLPRASSRACRSLASYMDRYAPDVHWLLFDEDGPRAWAIEGDRHLDDRSPKARVPGTGRQRRANPFSPVNQWILKVLLLSGISPRYWGGPRRTPQTVGTLAETAGVSQPQVSHLVAALEEDGHLVRGQDGFHVLEPMHLLERWAQIYRPHRYFAKPSFPLPPTTSPWMWLSEELRRLDLGKERSPRLVVGGHAGCELLGLGFVNVDAVRLYTPEPFEPVWEALDLVPASADEPSIEMVVPAPGLRLPNGAVRTNGLPVADVIQCYLDVHGSSLRGIEQARHILDRVLVPYFEERSWL